MKKYFPKGTVILLKNLDDAIRSVRNALITVGITEGMKGNFGKPVAVRYMGTDDTFTIEEDGGMFWYDTGWAVELKQRSE